MLTGAVHNTTHHSRTPRRAAGQSLIESAVYLVYRHKMQPPSYSACLYGQEDWTTTPSRHAQPLQHIDFRFKRSRSGTVVSRDLQAAAMLDEPRRTCGTTHEQSYDDVISGMYIDYSGDAAAAQNGAVIARRNQRERNRVKTINQTFARLRQHLPSSAATSVITRTTHDAARRPAAAGGATLTKTKKLSKVQILRAAIHYIDQLQQLLITSQPDDDDDNDDDDVSPASVTNDDTLSTHHTQYMSVSSSSSVSAAVDERHQQRTHYVYSSTTDHQRKTSRHI